MRSRHILENPHAIVGMRIFCKGSRWDYTIEKVCEPYYYPYARCLDHIDNPDLWAVCYDQRRARDGETRSLLLYREYCAYCMAEYIAFEHVHVIQHNGYGHWNDVAPFEMFRRQYKKGEKVIVCGAYPIGKQGDENFIAFVSDLHIWHAEVVDPCWRHPYGTEYIRVKINSRHACHAVMRHQILTEQEVNERIARVW